jgi:RNA 2',3'-cyclic 3'-phosphodiesterase
MRCFIALCLPPEARKALASWTAAYRQSLTTSFQALPRDKRPRLSWTRSEGYHLTLAFLGEIEAAAVETAAAALDEAGGSGPIAFGLEAPGGFSPKGPWRVIFAKLEDSGGSARIYRQVNEALAPLNPEGSSGKPFAPHITLARTRGSALLSAEEVRAAADGMPSLEGAWTISRCALYKSELQMGGSVYTELKSVDL